MQTPVMQVLQEWRDEPLRRAALRARLLRPYRVRQFGAFGHNSLIHKPSWLYGTRHVSIGHDVMILTGVWLAAERPAWDRPGPALRIGDRVGVRAWCTISASESIEIEDDVILAAGVTVVDSNHTWRAGHANVLYNPVDTAPVRIGAGTWVAERAVILPGSDVGRGCVIGANSVVNGVIPDHSVAVGSPARVVSDTRHLREPRT